MTSGTTAAAGELPAHALTEDPRVTVTFFPDISGATKIEEKPTLSALVAEIEQVTRASKGALPLLKFARFGDRRSDKGSLRHDENVIAVSGIEADYDAGQIPVADAVDKLLKAESVGIQAILYTSPSHTVERPRWRVLCPFSDELPPDTRDHMFGRLNGLFGGVFSAESWTLSQAYYYGSVASNPAHQVEIIDGTPIDLVDELDKCWTGKPQTRAGNGQFHNGPTDEAALEQAIATGAGYHEPCVRLAGLWARRRISPEEAIEGLRKLFGKVPPSKRDRRWQERVDDIERVVSDIYAKEAAKPASNGSGTAGSSEQDKATPPEGDGGDAGGVDDDAEIARLAGLAPLAYDRVREDAAKRLGCRASTLDAQVKAARGNAAGPGQGRPLDLPEPEPWREPVDGAALLDELVQAIRRYVVLDRHAAEMTALWAVATHALDSFFVFPRLLVTAPEKGCGKSTLLDVLYRLVPRPLAASSITAAALFRTIEAAKPTLLLDEADTYARDNEDLRSVLDAGHQRSGAVIRTVGDHHEPRQFSVWAPVALAAIGHLPGTVEDRSVIVRLRRRRPDEQVESLRLDRGGHLATIGRMSARWVGDHAVALTGADPAMPAGFVNRVADNWRPLLAVADVVGGEWPERARQAASKLSSDGAGDESSIRVALLADTRDAFAAKKVDRLASEEVVDYLIDLDERPWPEFKAGRPITKTQVARLLKPLGISSGTIRLEHGRTAKGYYLKRFEDAFVRYLPPAE